LPAVISPPSRPEPKPDLQPRNLPTPEVELRHQAETGLVEVNPPIARGYHEPVDPLGHGTGRPTMEVRDKIEEVLDAIRPALRTDGGDVELIDYDEDDGIVQLRLMGACGSCPVSMMTLRQGIERRLMMALPQVRGVLAL
jgi:Fe-S cluster biogenesis protein NfuA